MALTHGVNASKLKTSVSTPIKVASGVHFAVGAAPVQMVGGKTNEVIMANDYEEAVRFLGYSDDWEKYPLCMEIYTAFTLYNVAPVIMVNVLDPAKHKKAVEEKNYPISDSKVLLPLEALKETVRVKEQRRGRGAKASITPLGQITTCSMRAKA